MKRTDKEFWEMVTGISTMAIAAFVALFVILSGTVLRRMADALETITRALP